MVSVQVVPAPSNPSTRGPSERSGLPFPRPRRAPDCDLEQTDTGASLDGFGVVKKKHGVVEVVQEYRDHTVREHQDNSKPIRNSCGFNMVKSLHGREVEAVWLQGLGHHDEGVNEERKRGREHHPLTSELVQNQSHMHERNLHCTLQHGELACNSKTREIVAEQLRKPTFLQNTSGCSGILRPRPCQPPHRKRNTAIVIVTHPSWKKNHDNGMLASPGYLGASLNYWANSSNVESTGTSKVAAGHLNQSPARCGFCCT